MAADARSSRQLSPERALAEGRWVKLICGASNQDLPAIADLCAIYGLAGVHCIDVAAIQRWSGRLVRVWIGFSGGRPTAPG